MDEGVREKYLTLQEIVAAARRNLAPGPWSYLVGGTETETTVRRNRHALDSLGFRPRVLRDMRHVDAGSTLLGAKVRLPALIAPVGGVESFVGGGAAAAARASAAFGVPQMLSSVCQPGLEATAAAADNLRLFQLYVRGDAAWVDDHVRRLDGAQRPRGQQVRVTRPRADQEDLADGASVRDHLLLPMARLQKLPAACVATASGGRPCVYCGC